MKLNVTCLEFPNTSLAKNNNEVGIEGLFSTSYCVNGILVDRKKKKNKQEMILLLFIFTHTIFTCPFPCILSYLMFLSACEAERKAIISPV